MMLVFVCLDPEGSLPGSCRRIIQVRKNANSEAVASTYMVSTCMGLFGVSSFILTTCYSQLREKLRKPMVLDPLKGDFRRFSNQVGPKCEAIQVAKIAGSSVLLKEYTWSRMRLPQKRGEDPLVTVRALLAHS